MNVSVCVRQIPDPAVPGSLSADHTLDRSGKADPLTIDSYGVEMALQLVDASGGGEVTLISMAPNDEVSGSAHCARDGRGQGHPRLRPRARRLRCAVDGQGAGEEHRAAPATSTSCSRQTESSDGYTARSGAGRRVLAGPR